jgi:exopolyphosphatase/guanosine-5'-triphosphate,3'-diphosphate pyrophosphatase
MRLATIDVGTNTALLLISEWQEGRLVEVTRSSGFVRLGEGLDASGFISDAALERLRGVLEAHMRVAEEYGVGHVVVTGTSASRDARNGHLLHEMVHEITHSSYTILSGDDEAEMTFLGAVSGWPGAWSDTAVPTIVDVGGGSTEVVQGRVHGDNVDVESRTSMNLGSVRMTERFLAPLPPSPRAAAEARAHIRTLVQDQLAEFGRPVHLVGSSGTAQVLGVIHAERVGAPVSFGEGIPRVDVAAWADRLAGMSADEVMALHPVRMQGRADVFAAGVMILREVMDALDASELFVSAWGVRHGVAIRYFRELAG